MFTLNECKRLKESGFPQPEKVKPWPGAILTDIGDYEPTLDEVIEWVRDGQYLNIDIFPHIVWVHYYEEDGGREAEDAWDLKMKVNAPDLPSALVALAEKKKENINGNA